MTRCHRFIAPALAVWLAVALVAGVTHAESGAGMPLPVTLGPGSTLWLEGTSTMHDFESRTSDVTLALARDASAAAPTDLESLEALMRAGGVRTFALEVPVRTLKSGKAGLDKNLYKTMNVEQFPRIQFELWRYTPAPAPRGDTLGIEAQGVLTIVGKARPVTLAAHLVRTSTALVLEGSHALKMSDYGVRPPTMMLGALKVGDRITVRYRLSLIPGVAAAAPASTSKN